MQFTVVFVRFHRITFTLAAGHALVELKIGYGDRPPCDIDPLKAEEFKELVDLMKRCWVKDPSKRPTFKGRYLL